MPLDLWQNARLRMTERDALDGLHLAPAHHMKFTRFIRIACSVLFFFATSSKAQYRFSGILAQPLPRDSVNILFDGKDLISNLKTLDDMKLTSGKISKIPWADSYWPVFKGLIAIRYSDPGFPNSKDWSVNHSYILDRPAHDIVSRGEPALINQLSPAEKYDFLVGDDDWSLTNYCWNEGMKHFEKFGRVAGWMGICDGWSAASHMQAGIVKTPVHLRSQSGVPITFFPSDVKALQSMLWAKSAPAARFVGSRCNKYPNKTSTGRISDPECFDNNPATVHLALTNQLGLRHRSFVINATNNAEVWNYPVVSYRYTYYNPQTSAPTTDYRNAVIPYSTFTLDRFRESRAPGIFSIVGVILDITHVVEIEPNSGPQTNSPTKVLHYVYDLELDGNLNIIGGEWYTNVHSDFLWTFDEKAKARSIGDQDIKNLVWLAPEPVPSGWTAAARKSSARGSPLLAVINGIIATSGTVSAAEVAPALGH